MCADHHTDSVATNLTESAVRFAQPVAVDAAGLTHTGLVRASNEDHFLIAASAGTSKPSAPACRKWICRAGRTKRAIR